MTTDDYDDGDGATGNEVDDDGDGTMGDNEDDDDDGDATGDGAWGTTTTMMMPTGHDNDGVTTKAMTTMVTS